MRERGKRGERGRTSPGEEADGGGRRRGHRGDAGKARQHTRGAHGCVGEESEHGTEGAGGGRRAGRPEGRRAHVGRGARKMRQSPRLGFDTLRRAHPIPDSPSPPIRLDCVAAADADARHPVFVVAAAAAVAAHHRHHEQGAEPRPQEVRWMPLAASEPRVPDLVADAGSDRACMLMARCRALRRLMDKKVSSTLSLDDARAPPAGPLTAL